MIFEMFSTRILWHFGILSLGTLLMSGLIMILQSFISKRRKKNKERIYRVSFHGKYDYPSFYGYNVYLLDNIQVINPFQWLEYASTLKSYWIEQQMFCTRNYFKSLRTVMDKFSKRYKMFLNIEKHCAPFQRGRQYFHFRKKLSDQHFVLWRRYMQLILSIFGYCTSSLPCIYNFL